MTVTCRYAPVAHGQIHLRDALPAGAPAAPPLVCLHPSPVSSMVFADFLPVMAADRRVIAVDTPGHGNSDPLPGEPSITEFAAIIWQAIDAVTTETIDLFGYHTGSAIALEMARERPEQVRRIVLNSALMFSANERSIFRSALATRENLTAAERAASLGAAWTHWRALWRDLPDDTVAWPLFAETQRRSTGTFAGFHAAFAHDFAAALASVPHPITILNPSDDLYETTLRVAPLLGANARIHALPGWTHGFLHARPGEAASILRQYLAPDQNIVSR